jgi:23S rRNA (guanosine2251-2'-O)-methyltransferase
MTKRKPQKHFSDNRKNRKNARETTSERLFGRHAVEAALKNPRRSLIHLYVSTNAAQSFTPTAPLPAQHSIKTSAELTAMLPGDAVHQGFIADFRPLEEIALESLTPDSGLVLLLDQLSDPHNIGAILRSAAVFGVQAVITTRDNSPSSGTGILAKSASGALERVPLVVVTNLARAMQSLKKQGFFIYGLDEKGEPIASARTHATGLALVLGAEGPGLRHLTRENCDGFLRLSDPIPSAEGFTTLNVSNAAAIAVYALNQKA